MLHQPHHMTLSCLPICCYCFSRWVAAKCFAIPWTVARQAPLSIAFPRQEYWSELPFPSPEALPNPEIEPESPTQADSLPLSHQGSPYPTPKFLQLPQDLHSINLILFSCLCSLDDYSALTQSRACGWSLQILSNALNPWCLWLISLKEKTTPPTHPQRLSPCPGLSWEAS